MLGVGTKTLGARRVKDLKYFYGGGGKGHNGPSSSFVVSWSNLVYLFYLIL